MNLLFWITISFFIIGLIANLFIKNYMEKNENATTQSKIWWIMGTAVWGIVSIALVVWWFNERS